MKKALIYALLLCLGIAGCGGKKNGTTAGAAVSTENGAPEATKAVTEAGPETEYVTEPAAHIPGVAGEAPQPDRAWMPPFPIVSAEENCAHYNQPDSSAITAYVDRLAAEGFQRRDFDHGYLLWNDQVILSFFAAQTFEMGDSVAVEEPDRWILSWQIACSGAAAVDPDCIQALMPEDAVLCAVDQTPAGMYEATGMRMLGVAFLGVPKELPGVQLVGSGERSFQSQVLVGPAGCMIPQGYYGFPPQNALWADADGDGELEYIYWTYGPTSGLFTVALWAYGLEQGIPVLKAETIYNLTGCSEVGLDLENTLPVFHTTEQHFDAEKGEFVSDGELRIPLRIEGGSFLPDEGELPKNVQIWGTLFSVYGTSFPLVEESRAETLVFRSQHCLISHQKTAPDHTDAGTSQTTAFFVSADGIRVTGYLLDYGDDWKRIAGLEPIPAPAELTELALLSPDTVLEQLGPAHFDDGDGILHQWGWVTEDGKLLRITAEQKVLLVTLFDPAAQTETQAGPLAQNYWSSEEQPDLIVIRQNKETTLLNAKRWDTFLASAAAGNPDAVQLLMIYDSGAFVRSLRYDGSVFTLTEAGRETVYPYLITSPDQRSGSTVHYLLSDDPNMTQERYFGHMVSSVWDPDFPDTTTLFTVYGK